MSIRDAPRVGGNKEFIDQLRIREVRRYPDVSGDEALYAKLNHAVASMTASGPDAGEVYYRLLHRLGEDGELAVLTIKTLDAVEESAYLERWALLQLAIDLRHPAIGEYLAEFVRRPIPEETAADTAHGVSTVTEEVILRTTAIEGLARLFQRGFDATDVLLEIAGTSEYIAMRRAAWFALIDGDRNEALRRARELLERSGYGWIADLKRIPVQEAEQHDPRLINPERERPRGIPPPFFE
jgi:hypothetical protein